MARIEGMTLARGNRGLLIIALLAGLIAAVFVFAALAQSDDGGSTTPGPVGATVATVVAAQDIAAGTEITQEMLKVVNWPEDSKVTGAFDNTTPVVGEVSREAIAEGEVLTPARIGPGQEGDGLQYFLPPGKQAFALRIDEGTAVGGNLRPNDRVDVHAVFAGVDSTHRSIAVTVLQNVEVLALGDKRPPDDLKEQPGAGTVTLAVEPSQALLLAGVQAEAKEIYLSLRSFGDENVVEPAPVDTSTLVPVIQ